MTKICELPGSAHVHETHTGNCYEDDRLLAEYRKQYEYATLETHMLVNGVLYQRCHLCRKNPLIIFGNVLWCDPCLDEYLAGPRGPEEIKRFVKRKRAQA